MMTTVEEFCWCVSYYHMLGADWTCTDKIFCIAIWSWVEIFSYSHTQYTQSPTHPVAVMNPKSQTKRRSLLTMNLLRRLSFKKKRPPRAVSLRYSLFLWLRLLFFSSSFFFPKANNQARLDQLLYSLAVLSHSCTPTPGSCGRESLAQLDLRHSCFTLWCFHSCVSGRLSSLYFSFNVVN